MIASLRGTLLFKRADSVVLEAGGVGYKVSVPSSTVAQLPARGEEALLLCHTSVREDAIQIFGFLREEELETFELLITVNGVGPRLALAMLGGLAVSDLLAAIGLEDVRRLQSVPGVGRKIAQRVVMELKEKCAHLAPAAAPAAQPRGRDHAAEVVAALAGLGYKRPLAERAVKAAQARAGKGADAEALLREALAQIVELANA